MLLQDFVQRTIKSITAHSKNERSPPHPDPVYAGQAGEEKAFGRDSTSFDALGDNCQYRKRLEALPI